jgi:hypothetical protein
MNEAIKRVLDVMAQKRGWAPDLKDADLVQPCIIYNVKDFDHSTPYGLIFGWIGGNDYFATLEEMLESVEDEEVPVGSVNAWLMIHIMLPDVSFDHKKNMGDCYEVMLFYDHESRPKQ